MRTSSYRASVRAMAGVALAGVLATIGPAAGAAPPSGTTAATLEEGAVAPDGCWPVEGGCAARTGASASKAPRGNIEVAWRFDVKGAIEGEPRVWKGRVFVSEASPTKANQRILHALSLRDGTELYRKTFDADLPLEPSVWQGALVIRPRRDRLEGWAIGERMFTKRWEAQGEYGAPLLLRDEVYAHRRNTLVRMRFGKPGTVWETFLGQGLRGDVSVRGDSVYVVGYDEPGNAHLHRVRREDGRNLGNEFVGNHGDAARALEVHPRIVVGANDVFVRFDVPVQTKSGRGADLVWLERKGPKALAFRTLFGSPTMPAALDDSWIGFLEDDKDGTELVRPVPGKEPGDVLLEIFANSHLHKRFLDPLLPPTVARGVVLLGSRAFEPETGEILRDRNEGWASRPVPAAGLLLVVEGGTRLVAWREAGGGTPPAPLVEPARPAGAVPGAVIALEGATAVLSDDTVRIGTFGYDRATSTLFTVGPGKERTVWPLSRVAAVFGGGRRTIYARDPDEAAHAALAVVEAEAGREYARLAEEAARANDPALARRLLYEATVRSAPEADVTRVEKAVAPLEAKPKARNATAASTVEAKERSLAARTPQALWECAKALPDTDPLALRAAFVRATLDASPGHAEATAWVRSRLPAGVAAPEPFEALDWLDFEQAVAEAPVQVVEPPRPGQAERDLTHRQKQLGSARHFWRKDLEGIESRQLLVLTPLARPGRIARCLSMGELVCDTLEGIFAEGTKKREDRYPLLHHLYESKQEYVQESTKHERGAARDAAMRGIATTAGHYDPSAEVSRMFLPAGRDAASDLMETYAHELTHHWIDLRCPLFTDAERDGGGAGTTGYWIVEGFATFVEQFRFDLPARRADTLNPRARYLDVLANLPEGQGVPWPVLFDLDAARFQLLPQDQQIEVQTTRRLGRYRKMSLLNLFYEQSGAACHWLYHAEGGLRRKALLAYVADHYCGRTRRGDLKQRFGLDAEEMGRRIETWARDLSAGKPVK